MKKNKNLFILIACVVLLNACKKDNSSTPNPYFTFGATGNSWIYSSDNGNSTGKMEITSKTNDLCTVAIINTTTLQIEHTVYFAISDTAFGFYESTNMSNKSIMLKYDAQVGDVYYSVTLGDTTHIEVISTSQNITVPAGTFDCYTVRTYNLRTPSDFETGYVNKNAGIIKVIDDNGDVEMELVSKNF